MKPRVKHTAASVRRRAEDEYKKLDAIVRRLRPVDFDRYAFDERAPIRWTVKDVIAHITAWKWRDVRRLTRDRSPLKPYDAPYGPGVHAPNATIYRRSHRTPARTIVAEHRAAHRALLKALLEAPPEHFARRRSPAGPRTRWATSDRTDGCTWTRCSPGRPGASDTAPGSIPESEDAS